MNALLEFPRVTAITAGLLLAMQMLLAVSVSRARGAYARPLGDGGHDPLSRAIRRHGNLAENAGLFVCGFLLLEWSRRAPLALMLLCAAFVALRGFHAIGLSRADTNNAWRLIGGGGTYLVGLALGGMLLWIGATGGAS